MAFADLKNDFVFRRIFASNPHLLCALLNDLLDRRGDQIIEDIEYLPSEQLPLVMGAKLSILDVRCRDRSGATFVVEMQLIHVPGFINRVVYNACKAYVGQLQAADRYTKLSEVVAISICDFELWPDEDQDRNGRARVPMLSRWSVSEHVSGHRDLMQVQYAFLELPKLPADKPEGGAAQWAWLFVHAPELSVIPEGLEAGPYGEALELANKATFSQDELDAYQRVRDEIGQVRELVDAKWAEGRAEGEAKGRIEGRAEGRAEGEAKGRIEGRAEGEAKGKAKALLAVLAARGLPVSAEMRARIEACSDIEALDLWIARAVTAASVSEVLGLP